MTVYFARKEYVYSGGDAIFSIPFSYIKKEHISVLVNDEATENYTYLNNSQIQVNDTLETNDVVSIIRSTPIDSRMVVFSDTSILDKKAQNLAQEQVFDAIQEVYDNNIKFNIDTLDILEANKEELEQTIANNKQELLDIQSSFESEVTQTIANNKQELENAIQDFENEVNETIDTVKEAAEKVNKLEQAVEEAKTAAQTATSKADETSQTLDDAITEMDNRITAAATSMNQKLANAQQAVEDATEQADLATQKAQEIIDINPANTDLSNLTEDGIKVIKDKSGSGLEICDIGMALYIDETKGLRRYINGQIVDRNTNTEKFFTRLQKITTLHPSLLDTEENWQAAKTLSPFGQVGKFVFNYNGADIVSVRLPRVVNVQGLFDLQNLGMTISAGLPDHNHSTHFAYSNINFTGGQGGAMNFIRPQNIDTNVASTNASASNPIYGNSDTVQPEAIQYPYFIQIATGSETENNIINDIELNNPYSLFDSKYSDHELNNLSWLKSEGQWNAKAVYPSAYDELLREYNSPNRLATFNKDAFTVVGSPTITDDGVASGFSDGSYITVPLIDTTKPYKINIPIKTALVNTEQYFFRSDYYLWCVVASDRTLIMRGATTAYGSDIFNFHAYLLSPNTEYLLSLEFTGSAYNIYINGELKYTKSETTALKLTSNFILGQYTSSGASSFLGSIDLKQFSITVDGVKVFSGAKSKVKLSTETYTDYDFVLNTANETFRLPLKNHTADDSNSILTLYYYVGETVQNANLIDAGRIGEQLATKTDMLQASGAGMPSNRYIDLTLGASGSTYTAPANGYFQLAVLDGTSIQFYNQTKASFWKASASVGGALAESIECQAGDIIQCYYDYTTFRWFRFYYAEGSKGE